MQNMGIHPAQDDSPLQGTQTITKLIPRCNLESPVNLISIQAWGEHGNSIKCGLSIAQLTTYIH